MRKFVLILLGAFIASATMAQDGNKSLLRKKQESAADIAEEKRLKKLAVERRLAKIPKDRIYLDLNATNWIHDKNADSISTKWFSRGLNVGFMYDFRIKKSRVSIAPGLGFSTSNIYSRSKLVKDSTGLSFSPITTDVGNVKVNKVSLNYIEIPLELRIRSNPDKLDNMWKVALGFKAGIRIDAHTKMRIKETGGAKVYKEKIFPDFNLLRMGPTIRIGYSSFNLTAFYSILGVFKKDRGPKANEFSVGISFNGL